MGRQGAPTALKILKGEAHKDRINLNEPKPRPVKPDRPDWLSDEAGKIWDRMTPKLERLGVMTEIDGEAFAIFCDFYAKYIAASKDIDEVGGTSVAQSGYEQQRASVAMAQKYADKAMSMMREFGLTPSSRSKLTVDLGEDNGSWEGILD